MRTQTKAMMVDSLVPRALHMIDVCEHKAGMTNIKITKHIYVKLTFVRKEEWGRTADHPFEIFCILRIKQTK